MLHGVCHSILYLAAVKITIVTVKLMYTAQTLHGAFANSTHTLPRTECVQRFSVNKLQSKVLACLVFVGHA